MGWIRRALAGLLVVSQYFYLPGTAWRCGGVNVFPIPGVSCAGH